MLWPGSSGISEVIVVALQRAGARCRAGGPYPVLTQLPPLGAITVVANLVTSARADVPIVGTDISSDVIVI